MAAPSQHASCTRRCGHQMFGLAGHTTDLPQSGAYGQPPGATLLSADLHVVANSAIAEGSQGATPHRPGAAWHRSSIRSRRTRTTQEVIRPLSWHEISEGASRSLHPPERLQGHWTEASLAPVLRQTHPLRRWRQHRE